MKKLIILILVLLVGCSNIASLDENNDVNDSYQPEQTVEIEDSIVEEESQDEMYVVLNVPAYFYEGVTQEDLDIETEEYGYFSQTLNEDGSVTIEMSEEMYDELISSLVETFDEQVNDLANDEEDIANIEYSEEYNYYKVYVNDVESLEVVRMYGDLLIMIGTMYDAYTVNDIDTYTIEYYDLEENLLDTSSFTGTFDDFYNTHIELFM